MAQFYSKLFSFLSSTKFFVITVGLLAFQSIWLALTAIYPLPFDEYVHVGITRLYTSQWLPFFSSQPESASLYGDITRDPSYLYHYLMSFPYRLLDVFIDNQTAIIIILRLFSVVFVCAGLVLFRKLLLHWGFSKKIIHTAIFLFICAPIVPFLAAHNNYDNLMFLLTPILLLVGTNIYQKKGNLLINSLWFVTIGCLTSLVKHNFLPIFLVGGLVLVLVLWRRHGKNVLNKYIDASRKATKKSLLIGLTLLTAVSFGLFVERHVINFLRYKSVAPDCSQIQPESVCENFGPWYRNQQNLLNKSDDELFGNPFSFTQHWVSKITRGYFAIFSHTPTNVISPHEPFGPIVLKGLLPLPVTIGAVMFGIGIIAAVINIRKLWQNPYTRFMIIICLSYLVVLWIFNYRTYLKLGAAQAIQARYTYPILIFMFIIGIRSLASLIKNHEARLLIMLVVAFGYVWGGGIAGWLVRADPTWYWQNDSIISFNQATRNVLKYIIIR